MNKKIEESEEVELSKRNLIFKFLEIYFNDKQILYKSEDLEKGVFLIKKKLNSFLDTESQIKFLKKHYSKIYPTDSEEVLFFDCFKNQGNHIANWEYYVESKLASNPKFVTEFYDRVNPSSNEKGYNFTDQNFLSFYYFFNDLNIEGGYYNDMKDIQTLFFDWKKYSKIDHQLNWIKLKLKELESSSKVIPIPNNKQSHIKKEIDYNTIKLNGIFSNLQLYKSFEKCLIANTILDEDLNIIKREDCLSKKLLCALTFILLSSGLLVEKAKKPEYYKGNNFIAKILIHAINNTIKGEEISQDIYTRHKENTFTRYPDDDHLTAFDFIKNIPINHA